MLLELRRFIVARWTSFILHLSTLWGLLLIDRVTLPTIRQPDTQTNESISLTNEDTAKAQVDQDRPGHFPPTEEQLDEKIEKFIESISDDAICRLASKHNDQRLCSVVRRDRGSFNICFFVRFDGDDMIWVVRIPLKPVVHNVWDKVQSEVATMRYLERNTTIPIPHVHAYGEGAELIKGDSTTQAFLICDYISGQSLDIRILAKATREQREQFYADLINILVQLHELEFPAAGSLMPNPENESEPVVGGLLSMAANELQRCCQEQGSVRTFTSAKQYMAYQYDILSETYRLPTEDLSCKQAQMELFALDSLANQFPKFIRSQWSDGPFVLAHLDLRCGNIIVTEDLRVSGIIDWEFAGTIPRHLFTPPPWITGHDLDAAAVIPHHRIYPEFLEVLEEKSVTSRGCAKLRDHWKDLPDLAFPIAQIFRHPSSLIRVYYKFIFPRLFGGDRASVVPEFFERQNIAKTLAVEVKNRIEESRRYTQYLKDQGLFVIDQRSQANQAWLAKVEQIRNS
ncbi:hypothetical protein FoTM2_013681 [Fusarium oxysporum f. sp. vasinfectum]|uniref:Aminoglycoside phosphotransferase domain-containing protein n=1 Tax=Fusarium oxysporum f. sp. vasinfectum 25433 TaxID=1089449 RepID=X0LVY1_FUSOX|nr:hypothetical protein FOTG_18855 [Fusarium oxysporum f. sp. vasinfectum 25433]KAK2926811.1 hypothetical protein FoTM2_013681 [Fusarium oxysporum f. sp. vasinfectum]EXM12655.1 hypothetical protein FOTG_18855 [Fusarium oxysporum f. sp. vasinfectum 25433]EXM12656.1 hypothetical protein FOTG_18855 [Fusarium oxysporum f. sp. vasinfectum 25433]EXM12657.1 hypothetical protein FOTG_18855 [Fusarium oxysporum f. sp. vasinfectum 25433]